ncbi:MAG: hypothetical protein KDD35_05305, partial [Bdellovibrionales bacterium]|nr:hypothetical protein [Bdellovibrionales bacterium]
MFRQTVMLVSILVYLFSSLAEERVSATSELFELIESDQEVSCEALSNSFCSEMYNQKNRGNFEFLGDRYNSGKSKFSGFPMVQKLYVLDLVRALKKLPPRFAELVTPSVNKLHQLLEAEEDNNKWGRRFNKASNEFEMAYQAYLDELVFSEHPELESKRLDDLTPQDTLIVTKYIWRGNRELVDALYDSDEKWILTKALFLRVKSDLLNEISLLPLPSGLLEVMKRKINTIEISKPYLDPNLLGAGADCATTKVNAMYLKNKHKFTVCRGYLNSFESESNLYLVMAHELAHSIDPQGLLQEYFRNTSVAQLMREVRRTKGQLSCHDWRQKKEDVLSNRPEYYRLPFNFVDLTNCLVDRSGIKEGHPDTLRNAGEILTFKYLAAYANDDDFLRLINLNTLRYGEVTQNPFHLNPTLNDIVNNKIYEYSEYGEPYISLLFVQEYTCQNSGQDKLSDTDRVKLAIEEISKILRVYFESHFGAFGLEDGLMAGFQLSKPSSEDFADWMAQKAFEKYISKIESLKE